jgi:hypothetical protein
VKTCLRLALRIVHQDLSKLAHIYSTSTFKSIAWKLYIILALEKQDISQRRHVAYSSIGCQRNNPLRQLILEKKILSFFDFSRISYPPFFNRQGESRAILPIGKTGFKVGNKGCAIVKICKQRKCFIILLLIEMSQLHFPF